MNFVLCTLIYHYIIVLLLFATPFVAEWRLFTFILAFDRTPFSSGAQHVFVCVHADPFLVVSKTTTYHQKDDGSLLLLLSEPVYFMKAPYGHRTTDRQATAFKSGSMESLWMCCCLCVFVRLCNSDSRQLHAHMFWLCVYSSCYSSSRA